MFAIIFDSLSLIPVMTIIFSNFRPALLAIVLFYAGCSSFTARIDTIDVRIPPEIHLQAHELRSLLPENKKTKRQKSGKLEIVATRYSPGIRKLSYSGEGITETLEKGFIRVLVKYRQDGRLQKNPFY